MRILILLLILIIPFALCAQHKQKPNTFPPSPASPPRQSEAAPANCVDLRTYTTKQRRAFFPFKKAARLRLVSFDVPGKYEPGAAYSEIFTPIAHNLFKVNESKIKMSTYITAEGIDSLTNIMYNVGMPPSKRKYTLFDPGGKCTFSPRHAIAFLDDKGNTTQYIEICFSCGQYYWSTSKARTIVYCEQKFFILKAFFERRGVINKEKPYVD